jgi:hypothetical protein
MIPLFLVGILDFWNTLFDINTSSSATPQIPSEDARISGGPKEMSSTWADQ